MLYIAAGFYVNKVICASYMAFIDSRDNQGGGDAAAIVDAEVENQGAEDIAIEAENQGNGDTTTTVTAATEAENEGNEDTATATTATAEDTTTTASAASEGENQGGEHTATAT